jgi:cytidylate kinase
VRSGSLPAKYSHENATAQIEASDENRRKFLKRFYKRNWEDPQLYDLVINTARLSATDSANLIVQALSQNPASNIDRQSRESIDDTLSRRK